MVDRICENCMSRVPANLDRCPKCGIRFENTNPGGALPNGWVLSGRYTVGRYIDIDGEGVSYSAIDANSFQRVVLKEFMPVTLCAARDERGNIVPKPGCEVLFKTTRMDFAELYGVLVSMGHTEGLVGILDVFEENNTVYAVYEKVEGPTLSEYLVRQPDPVEATRALAVLRPVMLGVEALHSANVVHRGISPENIILETGGTAKLTGYATLALRQQGSELKPKLYAGYSAPEQYAASEFEGRYTDIYALGAVLYRMITGETPIPADERKVQDTLRPARAFFKDIPSFISGGISRAMRVNTDERTQSIPDFRMALSGEGGRSASAPPQRRRGEEAAPPEKDGLFGLTKKQTIIGGIAVGVVLLLVLIIILVSIFGKGSAPDSSSLLAVSSSSEVDVDEMRVPNFAGENYQSITTNPTYTNVYIFDPVYDEEYHDEIPSGHIISQTPEAGTEWDGTTPIHFTVSKGKEPQPMPDFVNNHTLQAEATLALVEMGFEQSNITVVTETNYGDYPAGSVISTEPAAGAEVIPGETNIVLHVAGTATGQAMPNIVGDSEEAARNRLIGMGISSDRIRVETVDNDGQYEAGTVASTNPSEGTSVLVGSDTVTLRIYGTVRVQDLNAQYTGKNLSDLTGWLNQRTRYYVYVTNEVANDGSHAAGTIANVQINAATNAEITPGSPVTVTISVYAAPSTPAPPPSSTPAEGGG